VSTTGNQISAPSARRVALSDRAFFVCMATLGLSYVFLIGLLLVADVAYMARGSSGFGWGAPLWDALRKPEIRHAVLLSLVSCTMAAIVSLWVAVPIGYLLSRTRFPGLAVVDAVLDIPIVLPPLVVGLSLLILFQFPPFTLRIGRLLPFATPWDDTSLNRLVVYQVPAVILAQFMVAAAFAVRTMKATFDHLDPRCEQVALTLGCTRAQAFFRVVLPESGRGMLTAFTLAWARALGEFGPVLIFAGATRNKTEVLPTTVFLELSIGDLEAAVAVSLIMVIAAVGVLLVARLWGQREMSL
jgi:molybdate transport system permease protein